MEYKRSRGCNYTPIEKEMLLEIISRHENVIENKETNAVMSNKKREIWEEITRQHNAVATTGPRTWYQLRHLYENIKQRSKKKVNQGNRPQFLKKEKDSFLFINCHDKILSIENNCAATPSTSNAVRTKIKEETKEDTLGSTKKQYFNLKLRNAKIKNKFLLNKNRMERNKYRLEIEILKLRLQKLRGKIK